MPDGLKDGSLSSSWVRKSEYPRACDVHVRFNYLLLLTK